MKFSSGRPRVAFQGERGAFSEEAAIRLLGPDIELAPRPTFAALFKSVDEGMADHVLVPVENSLIGAIRPAVDLFSATSWATIGEVTLRIQQHLIGCPGTVFETIETVESHQAALAQCKRFFLEHPRISRVETEDTAGSVRRIIELGDGTRAAIASRRAAEIYGGTILRENLEDDPQNFTRFVLLSTESTSAWESAQLAAIS
ncbi:MAG: prephenate dehydratase domain-containing protein, partial [Pyrinomonadaceae bacterium]